MSASRQTGSSRRQALGRAIRRHAGAGLLVAALLTLGLTARVYATTTISQGYSTEDTVAVGSIVSLVNNKSDQIVAAKSENVNSILGVVIHDGNSLLSLQNGAKKQVQVATSGIVQVLVSDINGPIKQGDQVTASPIKGVGMKATDSVKVVGIAQGELNTDSSSKQTYKDKDGKERPLLLGEVPVLLNVSYFFKQPEKTLIPSAVQNVANALAGKEVRPLPIIISLAIFVITIIVVAVIIYSMIRSSIISVGRNPMSQAAIYRNLVQLSALVLTILAVAFISIYMILTRF